MTNLQKVLKNIFSLGVVNVISKVVLGLVFIYLVRVLDPASFGYLNSAQALLAYMLIMTDLGVERTGIRQVAGSRESYRDTFSTVIFIKAVQAVLSYALLVLFLFLSRKPLELQALSLIYGLLAFTQVILLEWFFQGMEKMEMVAVSRFVSTFLLGAGVFFFVRNSGQLLLIPTIQLVAALSGIFILGILFTRDYGTVRLTVKLEPVRAVLRQSLVIGFSLFIVQLLHNFDILTLGFYHRPEVVAYYGASYRLYMLMVLPIFIVFDAIFPTIVRFYKESTGRLQVLVGYISRLMPAIFFPIAVGGFLLAEPIIAFVFGAPYLPSVPIFRILIFSAMVSYLNSINLQGLLASDNEKMFFWSIFIMGASNVILDLIFVPRYGAGGAAITTVAAEVAGAAYAYYCFQRHVVRGPFFRWLLKPLLAGGVMAVLIINLPGTLHFAVRGILGLGAYALALGAQRFTSRAEIGMLLKIHPMLGRFARGAAEEGQGTG